MRSRLLRPLLALLLVLQPAALGACLAEWRSLDWLAAEARLIVIGEVVAVADPPGGRGAQTATVRVQRVLKGAWTVGDLVITTGPIASCAMEPHYARFAVGERAVFLLTEPISDLRTCIRRGGSVLDVGKADAVVGCLERAAAWRQAWLARPVEAGDEDLENALAAAFARLSADRRRARDRLIAELRALEAGFPQEVEELPDGTTCSSVAWDRLDAGQKEVWHAWGERRRAEEAAAVARMARILASVPPRVMHRLACRHWQSQQPWFTDLRSWERLLDQALEPRAAELAVFRDSVLGERLAAAGVPATERDAYLAALPHRAGFPWFPMETPIFSDGIDLGSAPPAVGTTAMLALAEDWDRGQIWLSIAMNSGQLARLDADRLAPLVRRLCGSPDDERRDVGLRLIEHLPGSRLVPQIGELLDEGHPWAWRYLQRDKDEALTAERFTAFAAWLQARHPWHRAVLWPLLASSGCRRPELVAAAIAELRALPGALAVEGRDDSYRRLLERSADAAQAYLAALRDAAGARDTADDWQAWFDAHPGAAQPAP